MAIGSVQVAEISLENRLAAQKELVARIISEGKDATEANAQLYELSKALAEVQHEPCTKASTRLPAPPSTPPPTRSRQPSTSSPPTKRNSATLQGSG